jgi:hypothetical protein
VCAKSRTYSLRLWLNVSWLLNSSLRLRYRNASSVYMSVSFETCSRSLALSVGAYVGYVERADFASVLDFQPELYR